MRDKDSITPLKNEAEKFRKENNELHFQMIKIKEEMDLKDTKWKSTFKSLDDEISDLKFTLEIELILVVDKSVRDLRKFSIFPQNHIDWLVLTCHESQFRA